MKPNLILGRYTIGVTQTSQLQAWRRLATDRVIIIQRHGRLREYYRMAGEPGRGTVAPWIWFQNPASVPIYSDKFAD